MSRPGLRPRTVVQMLSRRRSAPGRPARKTGAALSVLAAVVAGSACAETADGPLAIEEPAVTVVLPTTSVAPPAPRSEGTVEIGDTHYQFRATCQEQGAGEVVVIGVAHDPDSPDSDDLVELYVKASFSDPYIGLLFADGTRLEPSVDLDSPLDLYLQDDVIRASAIRFVRPTDEAEVGSGEFVGFGEVEIHCYSYENELPA